MSHPNDQPNNFIFNTFYFTDTYPAYFDTLYGKHKEIQNAFKKQSNRNSSALWLSYHVAHLLAKESQTFI
jgi:hypothetical protein